MKAAVLSRKSSSLIAARARVARAARAAHVAAKGAKWACASQPGPDAVRAALRKALAAQNRALLECLRADLVRADLAEAWHNG